MTRRTAKQRFEAKYVPEPNSGCWLWFGAINRDGYGRFHENGQNLHAHRWVYMHRFGAIPDGLTIDHLCRVRSCVNPDHLEAVPLAVNVRRGGNAALTHCAHGHEFTAENTRIRKNGWRVCRACHRRRSQERYRRQTRDF